MLISYLTLIKTKPSRLTLDDPHTLKMREISVADYSIVYGDANRAIQGYLKGRDYSSITVIVDENTREHCLPRLDYLQSVDHNLIEINSGEVHKILQTCETIWTQKSELYVDRHGLDINLGGGVIGDMGGFAASCYMRGIDFVQVPTTLLSQVDASIGGKLAVDFRGLKNLIGLFKNPNQVIVDPQFIKTLPREELRSGYAEMLKHALIKNADIWARLPKGDWDETDWDSEIYQSILIKKAVVEADPTEKGLRKILNFGHTIGHAVESISFSTPTPLLHGEAIAAGMICEAHISLQRGYITTEQLDEITQGFLTIYNDIDLDLLNRADEIITVLSSDKKNRGGKLLFSLLDHIGSGNYNIDVSHEEIKASLAYLLTRLK